MKNPLTKRLPRELKSEFGKYLVIFLLLIISIGFVSGFLVADGSMIRTYNEGFQKYNIENGHFQIAKKATTSQIQAIEENDITLYENFYSEESITNGSTLRIFSNRTDVNLVCLMKGDFPSSENEIAIDRMYADNNHLSVGDTLKSDSHEWTITGLVALPDYSCLFQNNNDSMFDSVKFGVAVVTPEAFSKFESSSIKYVYSWKYAKEPANDKEEKKVSDDLMKAINKEVSLQDYVPRYLNQAINFTGDDMGSDRSMMIVLLYILIRLWNYEQQYHHERIQCHRNTACIRLYPCRTDPPLYVHADYCHPDRCRDRKYFRLYRPERCMCRYVLRKLQSSDLYYHLECGSFPSDNRDSDHFDDPCKLYNTLQKAFSFST